MSVQNPLYCSSADILNKIIQIDLIKKYLENLMRFPPQFLLIEKEVGSVIARLFYFFFSISELISHGRCVRGKVRLGKRNM